MRLPLKPLLYALLGGLVLLQPVPGSRGGQTAAERAQQALLQGLGGPVALCLSGKADAPAGEPQCGWHLCCLPSAGRSPAVLPPVPILPLPGGRTLGSAVSIGQPDWAGSVPPGPQQPRAPPAAT